MKLQTSVEFLIVLSAVALLCLFAVVSYSGVQSAQHAAYARLSVQSANAPDFGIEQSSGALGMYAEFQNVSYVGRDNQLDVILSYPGGFELESLYVRAPYGDVSLPSSYQEINYSSIGALSFSIIPQGEGEYNMTVYANVLLNNGTVQESATVQSYALQPGASRNQTINQSAGQVPLAAYIMQRNESVAYPIGAQQGAYTFSYTTHCAYHDFWGNREPEPAQCGGNSWGVEYGDTSCNPFWYNGDDRYYCFHASPAGASASQLGQSPTMAYSAVLHVSNSTLNLYGSISSANQTSPLIGPANVTYGNVTVAGAYPQGALSQPYQLYAIENVSGHLRAVNISAYSSYFDGESGLLTDLEVYNGTGVDGDTLEYIMSEIGAVNSSADALISAQAQNASGCEMARSGQSYVYECRPYSPLAYDLLAEIRNTSGNQSIPYEGSLITVR